MAKLLISVLYLSATMVAIFLLASSTGVTAKTKMDVCPAIRMGTVKSPQACTNMCKKKFGSLYYDSLCKSIKTKRPSSLYDVEEFKWSNLLMCGCLKKKKGSCSSDIDSELDGAQSCSSFASSTASSGHSSPSSGHSSPSSGSSAACSHAPSRSSSGRSSASSGSSSRRSGSSS